MREIGRTKESKKNFWDVKASVSYSADIYVYNPGNERDDWMNGGERER